MESLKIYHNIVYNNLVLLQSTNSLFYNFTNQNTKNEPLWLLKRKVNFPVEN